MYFLFMHSQGKVVHPYKHGLVAKRIKSIGARSQPDISWLFPKYTLQCAGPGREKPHSENPNPSPARLGQKPEKPVVPSGHGLGCFVKCIFWATLA
jgi:hypothetical protein